MSGRPILMAILLLASLFIPSVWSQGPLPQTGSKEPTDFIRAAAPLLGVPLDELKILDRSGLGKMEFLILALLHKKSNADLKKLLEQRREGVHLSEIIRIHHQDSRQLYTEAWQLRRKIDEK